MTSSRVNFKNCLLCIRTFNYELWNNLGGGNQPHSEKIFKIQKSVIRIITNSRARDSCRELFKKLEILPLYSQYIFSLSIFVIENKHLFSTNYRTHSVHTGFKINLHPPIANLTKFQKGVHYSGIKIFNNLLHNIKDLANETKFFRNALKRFLLSDSFYNSEEYFRARGSLVVKALRYKPAGRGFDSRWCHWNFSVT